MKTLRREKADCVPVSPDTSNMIPCRLTGKDFWDIYLYQDPPLWKAYIDCAKHFGFDGFVSAPVFPPDSPQATQPKQWREFIVARPPDRIVTQRRRLDAQGDPTGEWAESVCVYYRRDPPTRAVDPAKIGLPAVPETWEPVEGVKEWPEGEALLTRILDEMGDHGLVGAPCIGTVVLGSTDAVVDYMMNPEPHLARVERRIEEALARLEWLASLERRPDYVMCGGSGTLVWQSPDIVRRLALPVLKAVTRRAKELGIPTHIHSCGPERALVEMAANETDLTFIDPLEVPPMGDCDLAELKREFGDKIVLKGNLHTTQVMLRGSTQTVIDASKRAIDDAAEGGGFILSTGDQCGRDTPDENLYAMIETARTYGRY